MKYFIATKNQHKIIEFERILSQLGIELISEKDLDKPLPDVEENGLTFEENALTKAEFACKQTGLVSLADDSGLCVDALDGAPGVFSARYCGRHGDDAANNKKLLNELQNVPMEKRTARYVAAVACVFPDGKKIVVRGTCEGHIAFEESGNNGFGYDPLFISKLGRFGEVSAEEKDSISHRAEALIKLKAELEKIYKEG
ncbi:MAG: XTP/dITP diphosphatase [Acutalibacteraceae bacterium]|nr:XTP/dITP diphosphatase [Acutalibacteraceae bacterium]